MIVCKKRIFVQSLDIDNLIFTHQFDSKIYVAMDYNLGKRCIVFRGNLTTHVICRSFIMIISKKCIFIQRELQQKLN